MTEPRFGDSKAAAYKRKGRKTKPLIPELNITPRERDIYGATVTIRNQETRELRTLHHAGAPGPALREIVAEIDAAEGNWLVVAISSPNSIYRDLQGSRIAFDSTHSAHEKSVADPRSNESNALARVGRMDLLEPLDKSKPAQAA